MTEEILPDISSTEVDLRSGDPAEADCRCYMRVDGVSNLTSVPGDYHRWSLIDATTIAGQEFEIAGRNDEWTLDENDPNSWQSLPSDYFELDSPSDGVHMFYLASLILPDPTDFTIHTTVKCYSPDNHGQIQLRTTTHHDFVWKTGTGPYGGFDVYYTSFFKEFACFYFTVPVKK